MVDISTTKAALIKPEWSDKVPSPAYDSLTPEQRRDARLANPWSFLNVTLSPEDISIDPDSSADVSVDQLITLARESIDRITTAGAFNKPGNVFYLYQLQKNEHTQTALVADVAAADYDSGSIKIHEQVQPDRANLLAEHMMRVGVVSSPIAMTFRTTPDIDRLLTLCLSQPATLTITAGLNITQKIWQITDTGITGQFVQAFKNHALYIIDGHHRAAATSAVNHKFKHMIQAPLPLFSALFPQNELKLLGFNRWIKPDSNTVTAEKLLTRSNCNSINGYRAPEQSELIIYTQGQWFSFQLSRQRKSSPDVVLLQSQLLQPFFGIENDNQSKIENISGTQDPLELSRKVDRHGGTAIYLAPLTVDQFLDIADTDSLLPPKSTYFTPKVQSGVFLRSTKI